MIKSKKTSSILLAVMLFSLFFAGCNEKSKELSGKAETDTSAITQSEDILPSDVIVDDSVLYSLFSDIDNLMFEGNTNTANKLFLGAMEKEEFKELKEPLFNAMIRFFISTEQFKLAEEQYLSALRTMPEIAEPGFDTIYGAYLNAGDEEGALTWARILATQDIGEGLRLTADDWLINSLYRTAKYEEMAEVITEKIGIYETPKFASMVEMLGRRAVGEGNITVAEQVVDAIGMSGKKDQPDFARVMTSLGIYIDSGKGNWTEIASRMPSWYQCYRTHNCFLQSGRLCGQLRKKARSIWLTPWLVPCLKAITLPKFPRPVLPVLANGFPTYSVQVPQEQELTLKDLKSSCRSGCRQSSCLQFLQTTFITHSRIIP